MRMVQRDRIRPDCSFNFDRRSRHYAERRLKPHFYLYYGRERSISCFQGP